MEDVYDAFTIVLSIVIIGVFVNGIKEFFSVSFSRGQFESLAIVVALSIFILWIKNEPKSLRVKLKIIGFGLVTGLLIWVAIITNEGWVPEV